MPETTSLPIEQIVILVIVGLLLIVGIFLGLATIVSMMNYQATPVRDRLLLLKEKAEWRGDSRRNGGFDDLREALMQFSTPISRSLYGKNVKYQQQVKAMLNEAGLPDGEDHVWRFLARRVATGIVVGAFMAVGGLVLGAGNVTYMMFGLIGGLLFGMMIPQLLLKQQAGKRQNELRYKLPDTLDLMVVCVEAGLALDATIHRVADETTEMAPEISHEFKRLNKELNAGISRIEAFQNLGQRAGVDELRSLCAMIIQSDKMGTSISDTLRVYADDLRVKRRQRAEELASKASIKMTFPLVFFIFPPLFIVLIGPIVITSFGTFFGG